MQCHDKSIFGKVQGWNKPKLDWRGLGQTRLGHWIQNRHHLWKSRNKKNLFCVWLPSSGQMMASGPHSNVTWPLPIDCARHTSGTSGRVNTIMNLNHTDMASTINYHCNCQKGNDPRDVRQLKTTILTFILTGRLLNKEWQGSKGKHSQYLRC